MTKRRAIVSRQRHIAVVHSVFFSENNVLKWSGQHVVPKAIASVIYGVFETKILYVKTTAAIN